MMNIKEQKLIAEMFEQRFEQEKESLRNQIEVVNCLNKIAVKFQSKMLTRKWMALNEELDKQYPTTFCDEQDIQN
jgi:hypothetical protein